MLQTHTSHDPAPARWQVEWELCEIAEDVTGIPRDRISPESRMIQDLHFDSLAFLDFIFRVEDRFGVTFPDLGTDESAAKQVFTRNPLLLGDIAEIVLLQWGTLKPQRRLRTRASIPATHHVPFMQLGQKLDAKKWTDGSLYEALPELSEGVPQYRRRTDGMRCAQISASTVEIGSDSPDTERDEQPAHSVHLSSYLIDVEPVSVLAYTRFLNSVATVPDEVLSEWFVPDESDKRHIHVPLKRRFGRWKPLKGTGSKPMMLVSWFGANAYSLWANRRDWRAYRGDGVVVDSLRHRAVTASAPPPHWMGSMLPSEAQWEHAAQGATANAWVAQHAIGNEYVAETIPAADVNEPLGVSAFGLHHMAGNVWQWCRDWYAPEFYQTSAATQDDAQNTQPTGIRSERGGSWVGPAELSRASYRRGRVPEARGRCLGFRCAGVASDLRT